MSTFITDHADCLTVGNAARAFMTIGLASRLQALRDSDRNLQSFCEIQVDNDSVSRCYWSITILEQVFSPQLKNGAFERRQSSSKTYPPSAPCPPPVGANVNNSSGQADILPPVRSIGMDSNGLNDLGVNAYAIRLISIWGDVTTYLSEIHSGKAEKPWLPTSANMKLNFQMHECETQVSSSHLFRHVQPLKRSRTELLEHQEYWISWALMQIASHTIPAILNHPFIHLIARSSHEGNHTIRPSFYLQQTVDLALFHAGWVAQLLLIFERFPFEITNPVVGHMITATATVFWIFQFSRDIAVSTKAKDDLGKCERFLGKLAAKWPHIDQKLKILQKLQAKVRGRRPENQGGNGSTTEEGWETAPTTVTITFRPSDLWALLDCNILGMTVANSPSSPDLATGENENNASISLNVHVVPSISEGQDVSRQSTFAPAETSINDTAGPSEPASDDSFLELGVVGDNVPFFDDLLSQFTGSFNDWSNPQWLRAMPQIPE
ncbi:hypothetical protein LTR84_006962 [Exophiala bonariae]|uniref:Transcription factor domain-containing protein n=1 Tax=Exophiala bonariae TaxID=1690606 RepID=A0AAV9N2H7_9EURO|nr:hypothetical protein LTR84_006962 [Exophiala bonariae]